MMIRLLEPNIGAAARLSVASLLLVITLRMLPRGDLGFVDVVACLAILIFGMPHGALDLERLRARGASKRPAVFLYLACALAMYSLWVLYPTLALTAFLAISVVHFAEDWARCRSRLLRVALSLAILSAPALLHEQSVATIFQALACSSAAGHLAGVLNAIAPVAMTVACLAIVNLFKAGAASDALGAAASLAVMTLFPPIEGFALFFCLSHSPKALRQVMETIGRKRLRTALPVIVPVTAAALGISALLFWRAAGQDLGARWLSATFISLSILTAPHMLAPSLLAYHARLTGRGGRIAFERPSAMRAVIVPDS